MTNVAVTNEDSEWWLTEWWSGKELAVTNENSEWWPGKASRDQRGRDQRELGVVAHRVVVWESQS